MNTRRAPGAGFALTCVFLSFAACAPRGTPPAGRQLVADRISTPEGFVPSNGDGMARLLITRPGDGPFLVNLYVLSFDPSGGGTPPTEQLLMANLPSPLGSGCIQRHGGCLETDARGRLLLAASPRDDTGVVDVVRVDPLTGERLDLGPSIYHELSPDGQRLIVHGTARSGDGQVTLYDQDDRVIPLGAVQKDQFIDGFLYYLDDRGRLMRLAVGSAPELVATGVDSFSWTARANSQLLTLSRPAATADLTPDSLSFLDTVTLQETPSPLGSRPFDMSPDGQWLVTADQVANDVAFVNRLTGAQEVVPGFQLFQWRPGHDETWLASAQPASTTIAIRKPGLPLQQTTGRLRSVARIDPAWPTGVHQAASFTSDGAYWFSDLMPYGEDSEWQVGSADAPNRPLLSVTPRGWQASAYWALADGRLLAPAWINDPARSNAFVVDPSTGDRRAMGDEGTVIAVGATRFLMIQHVSEYEGDLTLFELATGESTMLASEFTLSVFVPPPATPDGDVVAPGTLVAFQYQARFASPYDGIWVAAAP